LIVCEGEKTEPQYLDGVKLAFKLSSANIRVTSAAGTDPVSIVRFAERLVANNHMIVCSVYLIAMVTPILPRL
jgi:RloB-like protein